MGKMDEVKTTKLKNALKQFSAACQELGNVFDEIDYKPSEGTPEYVGEFDDFTYDIISWVEYEIQQIESQLQSEGDKGSSENIYTA